MQHRRDFLALYLTGGVVALTAAGCTAQQVSDVEKQVAALIHQIQAGVVAAWIAVIGYLGYTCASAGKIVPTANSVFAVLAAIVGGSNVVIATAAMIAMAISQIVAVGCPAAAGGPPKASATASGVPVSFY